MASEQVLDIRLIDALPPEWPIDLLPEIRQRIARPGKKVVILDDDPTGTQTVHDLPVLTHWNEQALADELLSEYPAFFILTNSRSLPEHKARSLGVEIGTSLRRAVERTGIGVAVISRSDSTLRGHFPAEVDAVAMAMGKIGLPYLLIPFFLEGGRYTINDIHYVREGDSLIPAAQTPFAQDAAFGFMHSDLTLWIEEKSDGTFPASQVVSISLDDIRRGGNHAVMEKLVAVPPGRACIVNAASYRDMEVVVAALLAAEERGAAFLYRTAASFVRTRMGISSDRGLLTGDALVTDSNHGGLFIIGSYVRKTGQQLAALLASTDVVPIEMQVTELLSHGSRQKEIRKVSDQLAEQLRAGRDVAIYTSRDLVTGKDAEESLAIGSEISNSLVTVVRNLNVQPRYLVAKGGITSSDLATLGLGVRRAMVLGQALPGVPAWRLGPESRYPGISYIVFPGNVGDDQALVALQRKLQRIAQ